MNPRNSQVNPLQGSVIKKFFEDLNKLQDGKEWACNYYPDVDAYSILYSNQIKIYFNQGNNFVSINLPPNIEVSSCHNVFIFRLIPEIGIDGYILVAFGLNNYAIIHINQDYQHHTQGHQVQAIKNYENIQPNNLRECLTVSKLIGDNKKYAPRTNFPINELSFLLGTASQQKVVKLKIELRQAQQMSDQFGDSVLIDTEETLFHQEAKSIKARVSQYISSKLGYGQEEAQNCVKDIHYHEPYVTILTNKDIIIASRTGQKLFECDYLDFMKNYDQNRQLPNIVMRDVLQFKLISSSISVRDSKIYLSLFIFKEQVVQYQQHYQTINQKEIVYLSKSIDINQNVLQQNNEDIINTYDLHDFQQSEYQKCFSTSIDKQDDIITMLFLDFTEGNSLLIEYSEQIKTCNIKLLGGIKLMGYNVYKPMMINEPVTLSLITPTDVLVYEIDPNQNLDFGMLQPNRLRQAISYEQVAHAPLQQPFREFPSKQESSLSIKRINRDDINQHIYSLLDKIAFCKQSYDFNSQQVKLMQQQYIEDIQKASSSPVTKLEYLNAIKHILIEQLDMNILDQSYSDNLNQDEAQQILSDNVLISSNLQKKGEKLKVIQEFLGIFEFCEPIDDIELVAMVNNFQTNLLTAKKLRQYQEDLKRDIQSQQRGLMTKSNIDIRIRILGAAFKLSSDKLGYGNRQLEKVGLTSIHTVFQNITKFDTIIQALIELASNPNIQHAVKLQATEDQYSIIENSCHILEAIFQKLLEDIEAIDLDIEKSYLANIDFIESLFNLCERLKEGIDVKQTLRFKVQLINFSNLFMKIVEKVNLLNHELYPLWRNNLVILIENGVGIKEALKFAEDYRAEELLCRLVYDAGKDSYEVLHRCVDKWGHPFLEKALENIYNNERANIQRNSDNLKTFNKQSYRGFKMFDIFEERYLNELGDFLNLHNKRLFGLLLLRAKRSEFAHDLLKATIERSNYLDTVKAFSSIGIANLQYCKFRDEQNSEQILMDNDYMNAKLQLCGLQSKFKPDPNQRVPHNLLKENVTVEYLNKAVQVFTEEEKQADPFTVYNKLFKTIICAFKSIDQNSKINLPELTQFVWVQVLKSDDQKIRYLQSMLPGENENDVYTEFQIKEQARETLLYQLAKDNEVEESIINADWQTWLLSTYVELRRGLTLIFQLLSNADSQPVNFNQQYSQFSGQVSLFGTQ